MGWEGRQLPLALVDKAGPAETAISVVEAATQGPMAHRAGPVPTDVTVETDMPEI